MEGRTQEPDDSQLYQTDFESPRKAKYLSASPLDGRLPSKLTHPSSSAPTRPEFKASTIKVQDNHHNLETKFTNTASQADRNSRLGVETDPTQAHGDKWDDDFEDVDDEALNPANYPDEESDVEEEDSEEEDGEETITVYINLGGKREDDNEGWEREEAIESVEREEEAGRGDEPSDQNEGTEEDKNGSEGSEDHEQRSGKEDRIFMRSMNPSPEPSPVKG